MADKKNVATKKKQETSKGIVYVVLVIFAVSMVASYVLPILFIQVANTA